MSSLLQRQSAGILTGICICIVCVCVYACARGYVDLWCDKSSIVGSRSSSFIFLVSIAENKIDVSKNSTNYSCCFHSTVWREQVVILVKIYLAILTRISICLFTFVNNLTLYVIIGETLTWKKCFHDTSIRLQNHLMLAQRLFSH